MHVRQVTETGPGVIRVATGLGDELACSDVLAVLHIELADVAVEKGDGVAVIVPEGIGHDDRGITLRAARDRPVGYPVGGARCDREQWRPAVERGVDRIVPR